LNKELLSFHIAMVAIEDLSIFSFSPPHTHTPTITTMMMIYARQFNAIAEENAGQMTMAIFSNYIKLDVQYYSAFVMRRHTHSLTLSRNSSSRQPAAEAAHEMYVEN
jgi:hypothetical protein